MYISTPANHCHDIWYSAQKKPNEESCTENLECKLKLATHHLQCTMPSLSHCFCCSLVSVQMLVVAAHDDYYLIPAKWFMWHNEKCFLSDSEWSKSTFMEHDGEVYKIYCASNREQQREAQGHCCHQTNQWQFHHNNILVKKNSACVDDFMEHYTCIVSSIHGNTPVMSDAFWLSIIFVNTVPTYRNVKNQLL